jgi:hypothetical protein
LISLALVSLRLNSALSTSVDGLALGAAAMLALSSIALPAWAQTAPGAPPVSATANAIRAQNTPNVPVSSTPVRAAQVQIVDDRAHSPYQEGGFANCVFAGVCTVTFSPVPAGHRRLVEHISCSLYLPAPAVLRYLALLSNSFSLPRDFSPVSRSPADSAQWFVNNATLLNFPAGESPVAYAFADGEPITELFCTVSGRDIVLP